jgi:hypothetical protein
MAVRVMKMAGDGERVRVAFRTSMMVVGDGEERMREERSLAKMLDSHNE